MTDNCNVCVHTVQFWCVNKIFKKKKKKSTRYGFSVEFFKFLERYRYSTRACNKRKNKTKKR